MWYLGQLAISHQTVHKLKFGNQLNVWYKQVFEQGEANCERNLETFLRCIETVANTTQVKKITITSYKETSLPLIANGCQCKCYGRIIQIHAIVHFTFKYTCRSHICRYALCTHTARAYTKYSFHLISNRWQNYLWADIYGTHAIFFHYRLFAGWIKRPSNPNIPYSLTLKNYICVKVSTLVISNGSPEKQLVDVKWELSANDYNVISCRPTLLNTTLLVGASVSTANDCLL